LQVEEPPHSVISVSYREGSRHTLDVGAAGKAILMGRPAHHVDSEELRQFRRQGYALTRGEIQTGAVGMAVPLRSISGFHASIGIVAVHDVDIAAALPPLTNAVASIDEQTIVRNY
jgi:DNA-binding IclR family transcriptional regulator